MRRLLTAGVLLLASGFVMPRLHGQVAQTSERKAPAFEVAAVKRNTSKTTMMSMQGTPEQYGVTNAPLRYLIGAAYRVMDLQLVGGPSWVADERFDVVGKVAPGSTREQISQMLQTLLADRFKLVVHREMRALPIYELVVARADGRLGGELRKTDVDCAARAAAVRSGANVPALPPQQPGKAPKCGQLMGPGVISLSGATMAELASTLSQRVSRTVADRTGLTGQYDAEFIFAPDDSAQSDAPSLLTAIQEQLGLKLLSSRGPVEVTVIDHVEKPAPD